MSDEDDRTIHVLLVNESAGTDISESFEFALDDVLGAGYVVDSRLFDHADVNAFLATGEKYELVIVFPGISRKKPVTEFYVRLGASGAPVILYGKSDLTYELEKVHSWTRLDDDEHANLDALAAAVERLLTD